MNKTLKRVRLELTSHDACLLCKVYFYCLKIKKLIKIFFRVDGNELVKCQILKKT